MNTKFFIKAAMMTVVAMVMTFNATNAANNNDVFSAEDPEASSAWAIEMLYVSASVSEWVKGNSAIMYTQRFYGGERAYIYVNGDGDTDLDLYVCDENGNLVDSDTDSDDACLCTFIPKWTGRFTIKVKNLGSVYNKCYIYFIQ